ncbi:MAG TPA: winged helix-turn-helix domain-containing protein [Thermoplasmata archaeon]|nr:winged helix-turn-helix domain-containing protein [Thermoplasmata archaeon]
MLDERSDGLRVSRRREVTDLYATVLEVVKRYHGAARITRVSYGAGMPVDRLRTFLDRLLALGLLRSEELDGRPVFEITVRGQEFLDTYWKMSAFLSVLSSDGSQAVSGHGASRSSKGRDAIRSESQEVS